MSQARRVNEYLNLRYGLTVQHHADIQRNGSPELAANLGAMIEELYGSYIDPVTGLVQRRMFFKTLVEHLEMHLPDFQQTGRVGHMIDSPVVLVGDLAFLNFFNSISHELGDSVLARVGSILSRHFSNSWVGRLGGDEFGVWNGDSLHSDMLRRKVAAEAEITGEPGVEGAISHFIDIEDATLGDVLLYQEMGGVIRSSYSALAQTLFNIAMARAQVTKCYKRLSLLIQAWTLADGTYDKLISYARKGAGNVTDDDIRNLANRALSGEDISSVCLEFAIDWRAMLAGDSKDELILNKVANRIFYE